jgi:protein SCO1/2
MLWSRVAIAALAFSTLFGGGTASAEPQNAWGANYFPNVPLITQEGKTVHFYEDLIKDKRVMVNFIYTHCEKACPLATAKMAQVQKHLGDRVGRDVFMYSISLDPEQDTPEALKAYAGNFKAGPGWLFLTGKREDIDAVRNKLGQRRTKEEHNNTVLLGTRGAWMRVALETETNVLLATIDHWLEDVGGSAGKDLKPQKSFADAPQREIPAVQKPLLEGYNLFLAKCSACHTIGGGDLVGPDLKDVTTRRDPAWVARYLAIPDQMRAEKDPIATELHAKYKDLLMPNLGLITEERMRLMDYLEAQAQPVGEKPPEEKPLEEKP